MARGVWVEKNRFQRNDVVRGIEHLKLKKSWTFVKTFDVHGVWVEKKIRFVGNDVAIGRKRRGERCLG
jgi:hypothetical protein